jgi:hypothetical protein
MNRGRIKFRKIQSINKRGNEIHSYSPLPITWLISSILFFVIASVVAPVFWSQFNRVDSKTELTSLNIILGISGIIVYLLEPVIWFNNIHATEKEKAVAEDKTIPEKEGWLSFIANLMVTGVFLILIGIPYFLLAWFKPVLRAMILFVSLSFLNVGAGNVGEHPLFVFPVILDVLLYYLHAIAPDWKYNPVKLISGLIIIKNRTLARYAGSILLIIHTALIYSLLLTMVYYDMNRHPEKLTLKNLALWWLVLTVYSRMSFITDDIDVTEALRNIPKRILLITLLTLIISFIGFIWPFYFG